MYQAFPEKRTTHQIVVGFCGQRMLGELQTILIPLLAPNKLSVFIGFVMERLPVYDRAGGRGCGVKEYKNSLNRKSTSLFVVF